MMVKSKPSLKSVIFLDANTSAFQSRVDSSGNESLQSFERYFDDVLNYEYSQY
jgi:hypothetical protein